MMRDQLRVRNLTLTDAELQILNIIKNNYVMDNYTTVIDVASKVRQFDLRNNDYIIIDTLTGKDTPFSVSDNANEWMYKEMITVLMNTGDSREHLVAIKNQVRTILRDYTHWIPYFVLVNVVNGNDLSGNERGIYRYLYTVEIWLDEIVR